MSGALDPLSDPSSWGDQVPKLPKEVLSFMHPKVAQYVQSMVQFSANQALQKSQLQEQVGRLQARIQELESRLFKDSQTSHKPPSSDSPFVKRSKRLSLRSKTGKTPGGQYGRIGMTLKPSDRVDLALVHKVAECSHCKKDLRYIRPLRIERRQVFDIPEIKIHVTEHSSEVKICPQCCIHTQAPFPKVASAPTCYGTRLKALATYLIGYQLIPLERTREILQDWIGHSPSHGALDRFLSETYVSLRTSEKNIKNLILTSSVVHFDETPIRSEGKLTYLHVASK